MAEEDLVDNVNAKTCRICTMFKHISNFHPNKQCRLGVIGTCRECSAEKNRKWYSDNRAERQSSANERNKQRKRKWVERMGGKCVDCLGVFPPTCFDFHHEGGKDMNPSKALTMSVEKQEQEMSKCILLCANCHRIRHWGV